MSGQGSGLQTTSPTIILLPLWFESKPYGWTIHATSGLIIISCVMCALLAAAMHPPVLPDGPNLVDEDTGE